MSTARRVTATIAGLMIAVSTYLVGAPMAFALRPAPDGQVGSNIAPPAPVVSSVSYGSPLWVFVLIAVLSAAFAVAITVVAHRFQQFRANTLTQARG